MEKGTSKRNDHWQRHDPREMEAAVQPTSRSFDLNDLPPMFEATKRLHIDGSTAMDGNTNVIEYD